MPQMGESVVEGTVERWLVREGERVAKDQVLCEITTDKVDAEVVAPEAGVVAKHPRRAGHDRARSARSSRFSMRPAARRAPRRPRPRRRRAEGPRTRRLRHRAARRPHPSRTRARPSRVAWPRSAASTSARFPAAASSGRVTKADVEAHATGRAGCGCDRAPAPRRRDASRPRGTLGEFLASLRVPTHRVAPEDKVIPFTAIRRRIAEHMVVSKVVSPHVGTVAEVDLAKLAKLRERAKKDFERAHGFGLTYLPFAVAATVRALRDFPRMNSAVVGDAIVERAGIHVGVAVETERGLLVPVVKNADRLSLVGLAEAINTSRPSARATARSPPDELAGGTFTLTNPGPRGEPVRLRGDQPAAGRHPAHGRGEEARRSSSTRAARTRSSYTR